MAVSFDLFGTLVEVTPPDDPAQAVGTALTERDISVPSDWERIYTTPYIDTPPGAELSLDKHVDAALEDRGISTSNSVIRAALLDAFKAPVCTRTDAQTAVAVANDYGSVGILSNCSVPGLVRYALSQSELNLDVFDAVVSSVECGWRKPDERAFREITGRLGVPPSELIHVGDDPETDGGATEVGASVILLDNVSLSDIPREMERTQ
ncbi:HAD family hydrolase [Haladaptatus pallidirubidus]|uniref:HAD family hydrolase n=1 Tax=Haladaptatus pallidirubidus TaxID=1008152 RepID=A0AAV3UJI7_9EURY|nr:HAD family hydrolase [Haladaptatus pallidirubidus]